MIELRVSMGDSQRLRRWALLAIGLAIGLWVAYVVREIWLPLLIAGIIAMVLDPLVDKMERRGWSRLWSAVLIYALFFVMSGIVLAFAVPAVIGQTTEIATSIGKYLPSESESETKKALHRLMTKTHASPFIESTVMHATSQISHAVGSASSWVGNIATGLASNLVWLLVVVIVAFYTLKDFHLIFARLLLLVPREQRSFTQQLANRITAIFVGYLRGLVTVCALNAVVTTCVLMIYRVPNSMALGAIAGALYVVPYFGAIITIGLIAGVAMMSLSIQMTLLIALTVFLLQHVIFDYFITPRIVGQHVGVHPILSILALLMGGILLGLLGMILAVPFAATVQMILITIFPKLGEPIDVPTGEQLHAIPTAAEPSAVPSGGDADVQEMADVHQTIVAAVDDAEQKAQEQTVQEQTVQEQAAENVGAIKDTVNTLPRLNAS